MIISVNRLNSNILNIVKRFIVFWTVPNQSFQSRQWEIVWNGQRKENLLSGLRLFKRCPQQAREAERDSLAQWHAALATVSPNLMQLPASKSVPNPSVPMHTALAAGPKQSFVFSRKNLSGAKPTTLNPFNRLIIADSLTSKGLSNQSRVCTSTERVRRKKEQKVEVKI